MCFPGSADRDQTVSGTALLPSIVVSRKGDHPKKNLLRLFLRHNITRLKITLKRLFCEFWDVSSPGFAPNPFCFPFWFWGFFFGSFWSVWSVAFAAVLGSFALVAACIQCMHNKTRGEVDDTSTPSTRIITIIVFKIPRILDQGRSPAAHPLHNVQQIRPGPPTSLRRATKRGPEREVGRQPYCHTNAVDVGRPKPSCLFGALCARIF